MSLRFAYNTNGLQSHRLGDAIDFLGQVGYHGVALTLDPCHLDPLEAGPSLIAGVGRRLRQARLACVIETGGRFLLDPRRKHRPNLADRDPLGRMRRVDLLRRSVEIGAELGAEVVNLAAGPRDPDVDPEDAWRFLIEGLREVCQLAESLEIPVSLEPEPGHWVQTLAEYHRLREELPELRLTLDVAHVSVCAEEGTPPEALRAEASHLTLVHLEDAPARVHEHLPLGEGDLDLPATLAALVELNFQSLVAVELSRHSHAAHELVPETLAKLKAALPS